MAKKSDKQPKYIFNGVYQSRAFVRCWKEKREYAIQVWLKDKPKGEPDGDWAMPGCIGTSAAINQAILNTQSDKENEEKPKVGMAAELEATCDLCGASTADSKLIDICDECADLETEE